MNAYLPDLVTVLGLMAGTLTTLAFLPQVVKTWRTKSGEDLSLGTFGTLAVGVVLWLIYGLILGDVPIIAANSVTLVLVLTVVALIVHYRRARRLTNRPEEP